MMSTMARSAPVVDQDVSAVHGGAADMTDIERRLAPSFERSEPRQRAMAPATEFHGPCPRECPVILVSGIRRRSDGARTDRTARSRPACGHTAPRDVSPLTGTATILAPATAEGPPRASEEALGGPEIRLGAVGQRPYAPPSRALVPRGQ